MGRILGIDFGVKRVGIAVTDPLKIIASPLDTIETPLIWQFLADYFRKEQVEAVVVGKPSRLDQSDTDSSEMVRSFIEAFEKKHPQISVIQVDERFTSSIAKQSMIDAGFKKSKRKDKKMVDKISASLILQTYLGI